MATNRLPAPIPSGVEFEDRVSILLHRSGSEALNPVVGSNRVNTSTHAALSGGINIRLRFALASTTETVKGASAVAFDEDGTQQSSVNLKASWAYDTTNLVARANLIAGVDLPSSSDARRVIVTITTSLRRTLRQQVWLKDAPSDIVVFNGMVTTAEAPLLISMDEITPQGNQSVAWSVSFFPSWNDEIMRQHGAGTTALQGNIKKPYGGAKTVEVLRYSGGGYGAWLPEQPVNELTTMTFTPTSDGQTESFAFDFRSADGTTEAVRGYGTVKFIECAEGGAGGSDSDPVTIIESVKACIGPPYDAVTNGEINIIVEGGPSQESSDPLIDVLIRAFGGGIGNDGGSDPANPFAYLMGTQMTTIPADVTTHTVALDSALLDADVYVVQSSIGGEIGTSAIFYRADSDEGMVPSPPTVSNVTVTFDGETGDDEIDFDLDSLGWVAGTEVTVHAKPITPVIGTGGADDQSFGDIGIDDSETIQTEVYTSTGTKLFGLTAPANTVGWAVWFSNAFGVSETITFQDDGTVDHGAVKKGPEASSASLITSGTQVQFTLDDNGNNAAALDLRYIIVDSNSVTVQNTMTSVITASPGTKTVTLPAAHQDIDGHYYFEAMGEQGGMVSTLMYVDHTGVGGSVLPE